MPSPPGVMFYIEDWAPILEDSDDATIARYVRFVMAYATTGEVPNLKGFEKSFWGMLQSKIDRDNQKYLGRKRDAAYGGYTQSCKKAGAAPMEKDDWIAAGAPATYSIAIGSHIVNVNVDVDVPVSVNEYEGVAGSRKGYQGKTVTAAPLEPHGIPIAADVLVGTMSNHSQRMSEDEFEKRRQKQLAEIEATMPNKKG